MTQHRTLTTGFGRPIDRVLVAVFLAACGQLGGEIGDSNLPAGIVPALPATESPLETRSLEAEEADPLVAPMRIQDDALASGGAYIATPQDRRGEGHYTAAIDTHGLYELRIISRATRQGGTKLAVALDGGAETHVALRVSNVWRKDALLTDVELSPGTLAIVLSDFDAGVEVDLLELALLEERTGPDTPGTPRCGDIACEAGEDCGSCTEDCSSCGSVFVQDDGSDGLASMPAERYARSSDSGGHHWNAVAIDGAHGDIAMRAEPDDGTIYTTGYAAASPRLDYDLQFVRTGVHTVWIRLFAEDVMRGESLFMDVDDPGSTDAAVYAATLQDAWQWQSSTIEVHSVGLHTLHVWMREDGVAFDQIVVTSNPSYFPGAAVCGNDVCDAGEGCSRCPADCGPCGPVCGDGNCESGEDCTGCTPDCGTCAPPLGDDTFGCFNDPRLTGPTLIVDVPLYGEVKYWDQAVGTKLDATGPEGLLYQHTLPAWSYYNDYPVGLRRPALGSTSYDPICWAGGRLINTNPMSITWSEAKHPNHLGFYWDGRTAIFDGLRVHNTQDSFRATGRATPPGGPFELRNVWVTNSHDDLVEYNNHHGLISDSLLDGSTVFVSESDFPPDGSGNPPLVIENSLIRLKQMPGPYGWSDQPWLTGHGTLWKLHRGGWANFPPIILRNNIFLIEGPASTQHTLTAWSRSVEVGLPAESNLQECSNNIFVWDWDGPEEFPGRLNGDSSCATTTRDRSVWENAKAAWIEGHPQIQRVPGVDYIPLPSPASYRLRNKMFDQCLVSRSDGTAGLGACSGDDAIWTLRDMGHGFLDAGVLFDNAATGRGFIRTTTLTGADIHTDRTVRWIADGADPGPERWYIYPQDYRPGGAGLFWIESGGLDRSYIYATAHDGVVEVSPRTWVPDDSGEWYIEAAPSSP